MTFRSNLSSKVLHVAAEARALAKPHKKHSNVTQDPMPAFDEPDSTVPIPPDDKKPDAESVSAVPDPKSSPDTPAVPPDANDQDETGTLDLDTSDSQFVVPSPVPESAQDEFTSYDDKANSPASSPPTAPLPPLPG
ncbi:hypothetical protein EW146_g4455 [Bondarzewia mesenterica]|uniref:Uncharacterized protein n=1 Tax=Bondarzewia mesenterica TaxID=1095465 RepID=A0A4S4LUN7_9AGAM|nr:hypothetical protein EW146_g4455 [Bondarzewia mesenterica]